MTLFFAPKSKAKSSQGPSQTVKARSSRVGRHPRLHRIPATPSTHASPSNMETAQSFTARRSAASNLPTFQLPPPDHLSPLHKYPAYAPTTSTQTPAASSSSVLTPPAGIPGDGLSPLSSVNSGSSGSSAAGVPPYQPTMGFWPTPPNPSYTFSSAPPMPSPFAQQQQQQQSYMGRPLYSPSMNFQNRNANSPTAGEGLPHPPYDVSLPPFSTPMSMSGSSGGQHQNLPTLAPQQQQQHMVNSQQPSSQAPPTRPFHAPDYGGRPPPLRHTILPPPPHNNPHFPAYTQQSPPSNLQIHLPRLQIEYPPSQRKATLQWRLRKATTATI